MIFMTYIDSMPQPSETASLFNRSEFDVSLDISAKRKPCDGDLASQNILATYSHAVKIPADPNIPGDSPSYVTVLDKVTDMLADETERPITVQPEFATQLGQARQVLGLSNSIVSKLGKLSSLIEDKDTRTQFINKLKPIYSIQEKNIPLWNTSQKLKTAVNDNNHHYTTEIAGLKYPLPVPPEIEQQIINGSLKPDTLTAVVDESPFENFFQNTLTLEKQIADLVGPEFKQMLSGEKVKIADPKTSTVAANTAKIRELAQDLKENTLRPYYETLKESGEVDKAAKFMNAVTETWSS
jgi:hypothetical protein